MIIRIKNLRTDAVIGVYKWEQHKKQPLVINIKIQYDAEKAVENDKIADAVDYFTISKKILEGIEKTNFELLEKLVSFILDIIMENELVNYARVEVDKVEPMIELADAASVTDSRRRPRKKHNENQS